MDNTSIWDVLVRLIEGTVGLFIAVSAYALKGYHDEFKALRADSTSLSSSMIRLIEGVSHIEKAITRQGDNEKAIFSKIDEVEKELHEIKERVIRLESR